MRNSWLTITKRCFTSVVLLAIGAGGAAAPGGAADVDNGAVYTMTNGTPTQPIPGTNGKTGNAVVVYDRAANGTLTMAGIVPTGGASIGFFTANSRITRKIQRTDL